MKYTFLNESGDLAFGKIGKFLDQLPKGQEILLREHFSSHEMDCKVEDLAPVLKFYEGLGHLTFSPDNFSIRIHLARRVPVNG
jgi:hypothetical protein